MKLCARIIVPLVAIASFVGCAPSIEISHRKNEHEVSKRDMLHWYQDLKPSPFKLIDTSSRLIENNESDGEGDYHCGFSDIVKEGGRQKRYAVLDSKWEKLDLTWAWVLVAIVKIC